MRIVSKFKDYYDSMQKYADYSMNPYYRNMTEKPIDVYFLIRRNGFYENVAVGFCGRIYKGLSKYCEEKGKQVTYWSLEDANIPKSFHSQFQRYFGMIESNDLFKEFSAPIFFISPSYSVIDGFAFNIVAHTTNKCNFLTSFMPEYTLERHRFDTIIPKEQAYTELQSYMYFLTQEYKEEPTMSDRDRASLHGFDNNSFKRV